MNHEPEDLPGELTDVPSWLGELARMSCGCNPQGLSRPWGFFIWALIAVTLGVRPWQRGFSYALLPSVWRASFGCTSGRWREMTRRQQGILTGMPFMAHIAPRTFVDDAGRKIFLAKAPSRVVSLAPSITEMLFALGLDDQIVGVTEFCDYPPAAKQKPRWDIRIPAWKLSSHCSLNWCWPHATFLRPDLLAKLEQFKIPVFVLDAQTLEEIPLQIQTVGRDVSDEPRQPMR